MTELVFPSVPTHGHKDIQEQITSMQIQIDNLRKDNVGLLRDLRYLETQVSRKAEEFHDH